MGLIAGLTFVEEILMILGILLFVVLLILLIKKPIKELLAYFVISIIMIGWSTIEKISYNIKTGEISVDTEKLLQNPNDSNAKASLNANIEKIQSRANNDPNGLVIIANARLAMGDTSRSKQAVDRAIVVNKKYAPALTMKRRFH